MEASKVKVVWMVTERGEKSYWTRIGIGSVNRDGSLSLTLEALPLGGKIQVRDYTPRDDAPEAPDGRRARPGSDPAVAPY